MLWKYLTGSKGKLFFNLSETLKRVHWFYFQIAGYKGLRSSLFKWLYSNIPKTKKLLQLVWIFQLGLLIQQLNYSLLIIITAKIEIRENEISWS